LAEEKLAFLGALGVLLVEEETSELALGLAPAGNIEGLVVHPFQLGRCCREYCDEEKSPALEENFGLEGGKFPLVQLSLQKVDAQKYFPRRFF